MSNTAPLVAAFLAAKAAADAANAVPEPAKAAISETALENPTDGPV